MEEKELALQYLQYQFQMRQQELEHSKATLAKADEEIQILRDDKHRMGEQIVGERNTLM